MSGSSCSLGRGYGRGKLTLRCRWTWQQLYNLNLHSVTSLRAACKQRSRLPEEYSRQRVCECLSFKVDLNASTCCATIVYEHVMFTSTLLDYKYKWICCASMFIARTPIYIRPKVLRRIKKGQRLVVNKWRKKNVNHSEKPKKSLGFKLNQLYVSLILLD